MLTATFESLATSLAELTQSAAYHATRQALSTNFALHPTQTQTTIFTPTITPTATFTPLRTSTPFPTLVLAITPIGELNDYLLRHWDYQNAMSLIQAMEDYAISRRPHQWWEYYDAQDLVQLATLEALSRFPTSQYHEIFQWQLAYANAIRFRPSESPDQMIIKNLEEGLNQSKFSLAEVGNHLLYHGFKILQTESVYNLFDDGGVSQVIWISTQEYSRDGILIALRGNSPGSFQLNKIHSYWIYRGESPIYRVGDHTMDSVPEIIWQRGSSGLGFCSGNISILQWDGETFVDLGRGPGNVDGLLYDDYCFGGWQFGPPDQQGFDTFELEIGNIGLDQIKKYEWNGERYELVEWQDNTTFESSDINTYYEIIYFIKLGDYTTAIEAIQNLISDWTQDDDKLHGPSFHDYLRFQMGYLYFLQFQVDEGKAVLQDLIENPDNPKITTVSEAAQAFINQYTREGEVYTACDAALSVAKQALAPYMSHPDESIPDGLFEERWGYNPPYRFDAFCSLRAAFRTLIDTQAPRKSANMINFLQEIGMDVLENVQMDIDGNGLSDWVLVAETANDVVETEIWTILETGKGYIPFHIVDEGHFPPDTHREYDFPSEFPDIQDVRTLFDVEIYLPPDNDEPVTVLRVGDLLYVFRINWRHGMPLFHELTRTYPLEDVESYSVQRTGSRFEIQVDYLTEEGGKREGYEWNTYTDSFNLVEELWETPPEETRDEIIVQAENTLLREGNPTEAIPLIQRALDHPEDSFIPRERIYYLLGLAYELLGDGRNAVQTYWQLWHDYPDSPYALMARHKLVLRSP
jgi:tetratricopeptide (TPR) repeat protein